MMSVGAFLQRLYDMLVMGVDRADVIDYVYDGIGDALERGDAAFVDAALDRLELLAITGSAKASGASIALSFLTASLPVRDRPRRAAFVERVEWWLLEDRSLSRQEVARLLLGLK